VWSRAGSQWGLTQGTGRGIQPTEQAGVLRHIPHGLVRGRRDIVWMKSAQDGELEDLGAFFNGGPTWPGCLWIGRMCHSRGRDGVAGRFRSGEEAGRRDRRRGLAGAA
jgi:hypothetical protein